MQYKRNKQKLEQNRMRTNQHKEEKRSNLLNLLSLTRKHCGSLPTAHAANVNTHTMGWVGSGGLDSCSSSGVERVHFSPPEIFPFARAPANPARFWAFSVSSWNREKHGRGFHGPKFKYVDCTWYSHQEEPIMDLGAYFQILITIMMTATFVTLILILLNVYYGKDEEKETEED